MRTLLKEQGREGRVYLHGQQTDQEKASGQTVV